MVALALVAFVHRVVQDPLHGVAALALLVL
jgi:hypothetical protein